MSVFFKTVNQDRQSADWLKCDRAEAECEVVGFDTVADIRKHARDNTETPGFVLLQNLTGDKPQLCKFEVLTDEQQEATYASPDAYALQPEYIGFWSSQEQYDAWDVEQNANGDEDDVIAAHPDKEE